MGCFNCGGEHIAKYCALPDKYTRCAECQCAFTYRQWCSNQHFVSQPIITPIVKCIEASLTCENVSSVAILVDTIEQKIGIHPLMITNTLFTKQGKVCKVTIEERGQLQFVDASNNMIGTLKFTEAAICFKNVVFSKNGITILDQSVPLCATKTNKLILYAREEKSVKVRIHKFGNSLELQQMENGLGEYF